MDWSCVARFSLSHGPVSPPGLHRHKPWYGVPVVFLQVCCHYRDSGAETPMTEVDWPHEPVKLYLWAHTRVFFISAIDLLVLYIWFRLGLAMLRLVVAAAGWQRRSVFPSCGSAWWTLSRSPRLADLLSWDLVICLAPHTCSAGMWWFVLPRRLAR
jgi:hypothetical protein